MDNIFERMIADMKRVLSIILAVALMIVYVPYTAIADGEESISWESYSSDNDYGINELIEFEDGYMWTENFVIQAARAASGRRFALVRYSMPGDHSVTSSEVSVPDASYKIIIPSSGTYYICMRYYCGGDGSDSFYLRWRNEDISGSEYANLENGGAYTQYNPAVCDETWEWGFHRRAVGFNLEAGTYTLDFVRREAQLYLDAFVVTDNLNGDTFNTLKETTEATIAAQSIEVENSAYALERAGSVPLVDMNEESSDYNLLYDAYDSVIIEAESSGLWYDTSAFDLNSGTETIEGESYSVTGLLSKKRYQNKSDIGLSDAGLISASDIADYTGIEFNFKTSEETYHSRYVVYMRVYAPSGGSDSMWTSCDGKEYKQKSISVGSYVWVTVCEFNNVDKGSLHNVRILPREIGNIVDKIMITSSSKVPVGRNGELSETITSPYTAPEVTLPPSHPRLYFTSDDIAAIRENMADEQNAEAMAQHALYLEIANSFSGSLGNLADDRLPNFSATKATWLETLAFEYVINNDVECGLKAKDATINFLRTVVFDESISTHIRNVGHVIFVASEVLDWCYDLFEESEINYIISRCEELAGQLEVGYPPSHQGAVSGHAGEAQLFRDLLGFGIAVYDVRPDIYNYVAGRLYDESQGFIASRNYWYPSSTHHQGSAYGIYRYYWELEAQFILYRMTGGGINNGLYPAEENGELMFNTTQENPGWFYIYSRRPDGQIFRTGDDFIEKAYSTNGESRYMNSYEDTMFFAGNLYKNSYYKGEYLLEHDSSFYGNNSFSITNGARTPVLHFVLNDPEVGYTIDKSELPLTKYFASPNGMMIARTGWNVNTANPAECDDVVAYMKIGEHWGGNHDHLDAGNFQLYYKGILASESGFYNTYHGNHDKNYNKETIAHNCMLIYNPSSAASNFSGVVNSGGQHRLTGEAATFSTWMNGSYDRGEVIDHKAGPDSMKPEYSYIRGDITDAYPDDTVDLALRSMAFLPTDDEKYPAVMVVMDKVKSKDASYKKSWLLHMQQEPVSVGAASGSKRVSIIENTDVNGISYGGRLTLETLLPKNSAVVSIGGEGHEFEINGVNYDPTTEENGGYNDFPTLTEEGWGRLEVSPSSANETDVFLNVMSVSDAGVDNTVDSELIESADGNLIGTKTLGKVILFANNYDGLLANRRLGDDTSFVVPGSEDSLDILITGIKEGRWIAENTSSGKRTYVTSDEDGGTIYFEGEAGEYNLIYVEDYSYGDVLSATKSNSTINVSLSDNSFSGAALIAAIYDENDRLIDVLYRECTSAVSYPFIFDEDKILQSKKLRLFLWNDISQIEPLASSKVYEVSDM